MKFILLLTFVASMVACAKSHKLSPKDFNGIELESRYPPTGVSAKVKAHSTCPSIVKISINNFPIILKYNGKVDTLLRDDYYGNSAFVKVDYDSCTTEAPEIKLVFY